MSKAVATSLRGLAFADWFRTLLPGTMRLAPRWRENWARCYDEMIRIDRRTPEQIAAVCRWARADSFWGGSGNFMSPLKLRDRKNDVQLFDRFLSAMNPAAARRALQATREHGTGSTGPRKETL